MSDLDQKLVARIKTTNELMDHRPISKYYKSIYDFILKEGVVFKSEKLTEEELVLFEKVISLSKNTKRKDCFYNAQTLAMCDDTRTIKYHEGYNMSKQFETPIFHGFNSIDNKVIDVTHRIDNNFILGQFNGHKSYLGVELDIDLSFERIKSGKNCISLIDNWEEGYPLLQSKYNS